MAKFKYAQGQKFGEWELIRYAGKGRWLARCSCGVEAEVYTCHIAKGNSTRCRGCYGEAQKTVKFSNMSEYRSWNSMLQRCTNPYNDRYGSYGGRGITVCETWLNSFENFLQDMGKRHEGTSLDRIDVDGNYEPSNCRWATAKEQQNNTRLQKERGGSLADLAKIAGISTGAFSARLTRGYSIEEALAKPSYRKDSNKTQSNNTSGIRGISFDSRTSKWATLLTFKKKSYWLGRFSSKEEALIALNNKRTELGLPIIDSKCG